MYTIRDGHIYRCRLTAIDGRETVIWVRRLFGDGRGKVGVINIDDPREHHLVAEHRLTLDLEQTYPGRCDSGGQVIRVLIAQ